MQSKTGIDQVKDKTYDPRAAYEWVPAVLAIVTTLVKSTTVLAPYIAATFSTPEIITALNQVSGDDTFNAVWISTVAFWAGKQVYGQTK